jgi:hypothetical protein
MGYSNFKTLRQVKEKFKLTERGVGQVKK